MDPAHVALVVAVAVQASRLLTILRPLWARIPGPAWLPGVALAACGAVASWRGDALGLVEALVPVALLVPGLAAVEEVES